MPPSSVRSSLPVSVSAQGSVTTLAISRQQPHSASYKPCPAPSSHWRVTEIRKFNMSIYLYQLFQIFCSFDCHVTISNISAI